MQVEIRTHGQESETLLILFCRCNFDSVNYIVTLIRTTAFLANNNNNNNNNKPIVVYTSDEEDDESK